MNHRTATPELHHRRTQWVTDPRRTQLSGPILFLVRLKKFYSSAVLVHTKFSYLSLVSMRLFYLPVCTRTRSALIMIRWPIGSACEKHTVNYSNLDRKQLLIWIFTQILIEICQFHWREVTITVSEFWWTNYEANYDEGWLSGLLLSSRLTSGIIVYHTKFVVRVDQPSWPAVMTSKRSSGRFSLQQIVIYNFECSKSASAGVETSMYRENARIERSMWVICKIKWTKLIFFD